MSLIRTTNNYFSEVALGNIPGASSINKFGTAPDFDTGDGEVTIWDGANDGGINQMVYQYSSTADIGLLSSSDAGDTQEVEIQGLDTNGDLLVQTFTLNGQTDVDFSATGSDYKRVFRIKNNNSTDFAGTIYVRINGSAQGSGVPSTPTSVRGVVTLGNNQTEMAVYTVPTGKIALLHMWYASTAGASRSTNYIIRLKTKSSGGVFQLKHKMSFAGENPHDHHYHLPQNYSAGTDIEMSCELTESAITAATVSAGFDIELRSV